MPIALSIAGSDSGAGAGIQADLKTFSALGVYGTTVITAVTAQNTVGVRGIEVISADMVTKQLTAIFEDLRPDAVKIGMLGSAANCEVVARMLHDYRMQNVVLDPVLASTSGVPLLPPEALAMLRGELLPVVSLATPNLDEARILTGISVSNVEEMKRAAALIRQQGPRMVLMKGGHLPEAPTDVFYDGNEFVLLEAGRIPTENTHGTGCTLSSAIAAYLAKGMEPLAAVRMAKKFITAAIQYSLDIGRGKGPVNQFFQLRVES